MIFKYKAYTNLLLELGRTDSVVEIAELAIRDLMTNLKKSRTPNDFLKAKCQEHQIMVSFNHPQNYYYQITLGHIASVYHLFETFLYEMQTEFNHICGKNWIFEQRRTKLAQTIAFLEKKERFNQTDIIPDYLIDTVNYYHQLRVYFSHKKTTSLEEVTQKYNKAIEHYQDGTLLAKYRVSCGPKEIQVIDFEDFFLFTQVAKDLALYLSSIGYPDPECMAKIDVIKKISKYKDKVSRIEAYLRTEFNFVKENDSDNFAEQISDYL